jgi:hypothetical protein
MSRAPPGEAVSVEHEETRKGNAVRSGDLEDFVEHRVVKKVLYEQERHLQAEIERVRNEMPTTTTLTSKQQGLQHVDAAGHGHVMESGSSRTPGVPLDTVGLQTSLESWSRVQAPAATSLPAFGAPPHVVASSPTNLSPREPWHSLDARVRLTTDEARETFEAIDKNHVEELSQIEYIRALRGASLWPFIAQNSRPEAILAKTKYPPQLHLSPPLERPAQGWRRSAGVELRDFTRKKKEKYRDSTHIRGTDAKGAPRAGGWLLKRQRESRRS